jgi:autotransporter-associated beta strand protein
MRVFGRFCTGGGAMRAHLLTTTAAVALLAATSAHAQNATWSTTPGSSDFNTAANWTPPTVPTGTAFFGASNTTSITFQPFTTTSIGTLQFNPGAPAYSFSTFPALFTSISITGAGIVNGSSNAPTFIIGNQANIFFRNASTAGNAIIITNAGGLTAFVDSATGGDARFITNAGGAFDITSLSSGGMTAGSIEGAGTFSLGPNQLTVGSNNLSTEVSGIIRGTGGSLVKVGTGTLTLSGTNSYTGATVVAGGTLLVTGDISSSNGVAVGPAATLAGTGTVPGVLMVGGTLAPGLPIGIGTLNVRGNLAFTSAATYLVGINAITASQTNVTGIAALNGATVQVIDDKDITKRQVYTLLTATGGINGTFNPDVVGVKNKVELFYDANHVFLCDHCKFTDLVAGQLPFFPGSPAAPGSPSTPGSPSAFVPPTDVGQVAAALDAAIDANVTLPQRIENLLGVSRAQVVNALTQLTGEVHTGAEQASFQSTNAFLRLLLDPFAETRGTAGVGSAMGFAPEASARLPSDVALAYASVLKEPAAPAQPAVASRPWNVWASGYGGRATIGGDPVNIGSHDASVRDYGYAGGLDYRIAPDTTVGFALGGAGTDWSVANALGTGRSDVFQGGIYGSTRWGAAYVSAALAYASYWMSTDRFVNVFGTDHLTSNFTAHDFSGRIESGYRFALPLVAVTPYGAFQAQRLYLPAYSEVAPAGSPFALTYNAQNFATTRSELGAWFDRLVLVADAYAGTVFARAAWAHDWRNDRALSTSFLTLPTPAFIINGAAPPPDKALVSGGSELRLRNGWSVMGKFDGEFASRLQSYAGTGTVRYVW